MNYQLRGLEPALFEGFFNLTGSALADRGMRWMRVDKPVGEDVLLRPDLRAPRSREGRADRE